MREIKFRAWDKENKIMYYQGEFKVCDDYYTNIFFIDNWGWSLWGVKEYTNPILSERKLLTNHKRGILMQYIGKKDKNKKEIYEKDIIELYSKNGEFINAGVVIFDEGAFCVALKGHEDAPPDFIMLGDTFEIKVVGNIYENPELLWLYGIKLGEDKWNV